MFIRELFKTMLDAKRDHVVPVVGGMAGKFRRLYKAICTLAGKMLTWRENFGGITKKKLIECTFSTIVYSRVALTTSW